METMNAEQPAISVIMPCYNRSHDLRRILEAYDQQDAGQPFEIIAIDDASMDDTFALLSGFHANHFRLIAETQSHNQGPAAARNRALGLVSAPLVVIVGDDILPERDFIRRHLDAHQFYPEENTAILGRVCWPDDMPCNTLMRHIDGIGAQQFGYHYLHSGRDYSFFHFYTANISIKMNMLRKLDHWFDTDFPYAAWEDAELSYRLWRKQGMRIKYIASPTGRHYHYHNIWTFSARQYQVGRMAQVMVRKHPELELVLRGPARRALGYGMRALAGTGRRRPHAALEARALELASLHEWDGHPLLDIFYLRLLEYYYFKGWIDALFGRMKPVSRIHDAHARLRLVRAIHWLDDAA